MLAVLWLERRDIMFQALSTKTQELETLKIEWDSKQTELNAKYSQQVTSEKEKAFEVRSIPISGSVSKWTSSRGLLRMILHLWVEKFVFHRKVPFMQLQAQSTYQQRMERERKELEQAHLNIVKQMETKLYELENSNKVGVEVNSSSRKFQSIHVRF